MLFTKKMEEDGFTLSILPSELNKIFNTLRVDDDEKMIKFFQSRVSHRLYLALKRRLGFILEENNIALKAAVLHPSYTHLECVENKLKESVWESLADEAIKNPSVRQKQLYTDLESFSNFIKVSFSAARGLLSSFSKEGIPLAEVYSSPELYVIAPLAKKYLCIPASAATVERLFSSTGNLMQGREGNLDLETLEQLQKLKHATSGEDYKFETLLNDLLAFK